jgi:hypothetical protein
MQAALANLFNVMKHLFLCLLVMPLFLNACNRMPREEKSTDLGFGFREETHAELTHGGFEGVMHQRYLFYKKQKLCNVGKCSVAPSGDYAIYQDGPSGNLFLFRRADHKITQLTPKFIALVESFIWHEDKASVAVQFYDGHAERTFPLH